MTKVGAHVSIAGGVENAPRNAHLLECECFQIFTRSPRGGKRKEIDEQKFFKACERYNFEVGKDYIIHAPYYINLASQEEKIYKSSIRILKEELKIADQIKSPFVITHLGSSKDLNKTENWPSIQQKVFKGLREIYQDYQGKAILSLEIAAGSGNIIGDNLEEFSYFLNEADKLGIKMGFCFDTCHAFAAGKDLRTPKKVQKTFKEIDEKIGLEKLNCIHFNDSKSDFDSHIDRHEHIGKGKIGNIGMKAVAKKAKQLDINLYLETKHDKIKKDIKITKGFLDNNAIK
jgi:deoxyribonuclease-4